MSFSNYTAQAVLNAIFGRTSNFGSLGSEPDKWIALSTTAPDEDGGNVSEPSGDGYDRVETTSGDWNDATDADPSVIDNSATITFPEATGSWGEITHFAIFDSQTGGEMLASGSLDTSRTVEDGDEPRFQAGELEVTLT